MGVTSAVRKSLQEDSLILKNRHEEFLRKLPSPSHSPSVSAVVSPASSTHPLPQTPHYYSESVSSVAFDSSIEESILRLRRPRRISVSPNDIALLSDENAELLAKLEKLEAESAQADMAGRRKLRKLEKEIQGLREELEQTQVKSEELEVKAKNGFDAEKVADEMWRKKMEREEKCRAMRGKSDSDLGGDGVKDFAPGSTAISSGGSPNITPVKQVSQPAANSQNSLPTFHFPKRHLGRDIEGDLFSAQSQPFVTPERELAVVSQLLMKIRELEDTNAQISDQQAKTAVTLHSVQRDAETIRRVYEGLGDAEGVEWEVVADEDRETGRNAKRPEDDTIRFKSYRRSLDCTPSRLMPTSENFFDGGIAGSMRSTVNSAALNRIIMNHKERKSVVGLFDMPPTPGLSSSRMIDSPVPFPMDTDSPHLDWPINGTLHSPALFGISPMPSPIGETGPTLRSELGSEFGDEWGTTAVSHHLRNTSLYQLAIPSAPPSPALTSRHIQADGILDSISRESPKLQTASFRSRSGLQSWDQSLQSGTIIPDRGHQTDRYQRLSQTIRSRTNQWADGRFKETLLGSKGSRLMPTENTGSRKSLAPMPRSLAGVFDSVVGTLVQPGTREVGTSEDPNEDNSQKATANMDSSSIGNPSYNNAKGLSKVIFELWLWLQFCVIILIFLWAMAKRGPKSVFDDAEKRRAKRHHS
jgi:hypothetical protein